MQGFKNRSSAQRLLEAHAAVYNMFNIQRHMPSCGAGLPQRVSGKPQEMAFGDSGDASFKQTASLPAEGGLKAQRTFRPASQTVL